MQLQGCARFPDFTQNFSEHQILWSLCSVDFYTLTLRLPIQTPHSVVPELQVFVSSLENCQNFSKMSTPLHNVHATENLAVLKSMLKISARVEICNAC